MEYIAHNIGDIAKRVALPFFIFCAVLATLLTLSWFLLLPMQTQVEVAGVERDLEALESYTSDLKAQISSLEDQRTSFLSRQSKQVYLRLKDMKKRRETYQAFRSALLGVSRTVSPEKPDAVRIRSWYYDATKRTMRISGDVRNVSTRSMTVLANFIHQIEQIPMVTRVTSSPFTRLDDPVLGLYSPFTLDILLQHEAMR